ncbi:hypothetical protein WR25_13522 [Diploscapter pachys]|uniref:Nucleotide-diphospho-sugar transferase domain-containing protein n=1 Tax=Diploscapter pachys TaxID=2018661 RepID=A0A2A2JVP3_9BILA|nr:hypothetical protein WR25_13522 [Diploscapter pachys]
MKLSLAYRMSELHPTIPYIILVTEDISPESIESLEQHNISVLPFHKIDTPYLPTHKARKYQYTKIHLWSLTNYTSICHMDLDVLPLADLSSLFHCGSFCASFRHSDMFNSGVFVLRPNMTIYEDMVQKIGQLYSYDGGDQGFLNSYFHELKFAPMFDDVNVDRQRYSSSMMT